jgi:hypothetical protein
MKSMLLTPALGLVLIASSWAASDDIKFPVSFGKLAERATESVDVTLDSSLLHLASGFLSDDDKDDATVKKLVSKLKGVYVRSFEFDKDGQYSTADVEAIRTQLKTPQWSRIVGSKSSKGETSEIYVKKNGDAITGLVVIDAAPREFTVVHIDGPINPDQLSELSGHVGIPKFGKSKSGKSNKED